MHIDDKSAIYSKIIHGLPQGSLLRAVQLNFYILPLGSIIKKHSTNFHCYVDVTQLYLSMKPYEINQLAKLQACLKDIKIQMTRNFLLLNSDKTEVIVLGLQLRNALSNHISNLDFFALASPLGTLELSLFRICPLTK